MRGRSRAVGEVVVITTTMPGRFGDVLWALPTVRAIAEAHPDPVSLVVSAKYHAIVPLLRAQPYLASAYADMHWAIEETAPMTPRRPPNAQPDWVHLSYVEWPTHSLPNEIATRAGVVADLDRPWITAPHDLSGGDHTRIFVGWSEEHFELKVGLTVALAARFPDLIFWWLRPSGGRYDEVDRSAQVGERLGHSLQHRLGPNVQMIRCDWRQAAALAATCHAYVGCLSALWVLANGLGLPAVVVEPNPQRHHPIFWLDRSRNRLVLGNDGQPTWDARHAGDVLAAVLKEAGCD